VEELADRPVDYKSSDSPGFMRLMPLSEIIATVIDAASPSTQAVWKIYNPLISKFGDEYKILIDTPKEALAEVVDQRFADAIVKVREGAVKVVPGYDGVYGKLVLPADTDAANVEATPNSPRLKHPRGRVQQTGLSDFW
jgi:PHP family Zn ribbon phosphoesterase